MEVHELRVGNMIKIDGVVATIDERTIFDFNHDNRRKDGIPLTREWLNRTGFKNTGLTYWISLYNLKAELHFKYYKNGPVITIKSDFANLILDPIIYVHQLQNLYFILSSNGEELTCNPQPVTFHRHENHRKK